MKNLGYFILDGQPVFRSFVQIDVLITRGHQVQEITEEEYIRRFAEYEKTLKYRVG